MFASLVDLHAVSTIRRLHFLLRCKRFFYWLSKKIKTQSLDTASVPTGIFGAVAIRPVWESKQKDSILQEDIYMSWIEIKDLQERAAKAQKTSDDIVKEARSSNTELTAEQHEIINRCHEDFTAAENQIKMLKRQEEINKTVEERLGREDIEQPEQRNNDDLANRAFEKMLRYGANSLSQEERQAHEQRAMSAGTATEGAEFVPELFHNSFYKVLQDYRGVREAGPTVITTSTGNTYSMPKLDDTSNTGELLSENSAADDSNADPDTSSLDLNAYIYSSKIVKASVSLVQDSAFDVQGWLAPALAERIGKIQNTHFTTGDNSSKPQGVVSGSSAGKVAASTSAITYNEILDLIHSVSRAYRAGCKLMMTDATLLAIKKLTDADGNHLFLYGRPESNIPSTIGGYPYVINNDMAELSDGVSSKVMLFGDFKRGYVIRDVVGMNLFVFNEKYMNSLQYGYLGWVRSDAGVIDSNCIKHLALAAA